MSDLTNLTDKLGVSENYLRCYVDGRVDHGNNAYFNPDADNCRTYIDQTTTAIYNNFGACTRAWITFLSIIGCCCCVDKESLVKREVRALITAHDKEQATKADSLAAGYLTRRHTDSESNQPAPTIVQSSSFSRSRSDSDDLTWTAEDENMLKFYQNVQVPNARPSQAHQALLDRKELIRLNKAIALPEQI